MTSSKDGRVSKNSTGSRLAVENKKKAWIAKKWSLMQFCKFDRVRITSVLFFKNTGRSFSRLF